MVARSAEHCYFMARGEPEISGPPVTPCVTDRDGHRYKYPYVNHR